MTASTPASPHDDVEADARHHFERGDFEGAATVAIRRYGPEIYSFVGSRHHDRDEADEVFARFAEGLWKALPGFAWASSLRTFAYSIARNKSLHFRREAGRRRKRETTVDDESVASRIAAEVRSATAPILRSEVKNRFTELRASLPEEDQELLILRVDRNLSWLDLAHVLHPEGEPALTPEAHKREAARLRKRFQLLKDKLREMATREGLLPEPDDDSQ